ncbi:amino acid adenylation domain-containing protein [Streptomyces sp. NPDC002825]|uniref:amino acid adenylation domain-containing protein n=1 Tax=Streptomyces sp. NPDC002825 TaxID=3154666 RepID=UPI00332B3273
MPLSSSTPGAPAGTVPGPAAGTGAETDPFALLRGAARVGEAAPAADLPWSPADDGTTPTAVLAALAVVVGAFTGHRTVLYEVDGTTRIVEGPKDDLTVAAYLDTVAAAPAVPATAGTPAVRLSTAAPGDQPEDAGTAATLSVRIDPDRARLRLTAPTGDLPEWLLHRIGASVLWVYGRLADPECRHEPAADVRPQSPHDDAATAELGRTPGPEGSRPGTIPGGFRRQALSTPGAPALSGGGRVLTYGELDTWTDALSRELTRHGVRPGARVAVVMERSADTVAVLLAVLKAGAVYVPLEPDLPADRLTFIVEDSGVSLAVVDDEEAVDLPGLPCVGLGVLAAAARRSQDGATGTGAEGEEAGPGPGPDDPAYIIYTSGSTGRPKGVVVPHRNVAALVEGTAEGFGFGGDDVWSWFHSAAFDFSVWEMWGCLLTGGRLVVVPNEARRSPEEFRALLAETGVTVLNQTPSSFFQLVDLQHTERRELAVRLVVFGGEALDTAGLVRWLDLHPESECRLVNMFGITETTVHVTAQDITRDLALAATRSVGRAIPGWSVRVVDERGRVLPVGAVGEIAVGGDGLAVGYLDREELTAARFVTEPGTGERLYLSGDRGRMLPDGALEHLGRLDQQVKIRGHRIELGEIRSVLLADPEVIAAAVVVGHALPGDPAGDRLDAYLVPVAGASVPAIRERAAAKLPAYMIPATFTSLPALPVTVNGKLDTAALPSPGSGQEDPAALTDGPAGDLSAERRIQDAWMAVTGSQVGPDQNFFDAGGNSLLAARFVRGLRETGLGPLTVKQFYLHPTPRRLAALCEEPADQGTDTRTKGNPA